MLHAIETLVNVQSKIKYNIAINTNTLQQGIVEEAESQLKSRLLSDPSRLSRMKGPAAGGGPPPLAASIL